MVQTTLFEAETAEEKEGSPVTEPVTDSQETITPVNGSAEPSVVSVSKGSAQRNTSVTENALPCSSSGRNDDSINKISPKAAVHSDKSYDTRILYCGYMKTHFARQDYSYLSRFYRVETLDFSKVAASFNQVPEYLGQVITKILPGVLRNDVIWIWFADYPAFPIVLLAKLFGKKVIINHGGGELYPPNEIGYGFQMKKKRGAIARWLARNADMNIIMSEAYWKILHDCVPSAPLYVIPGCVEASEYTPDFKKKEEVAVTAYCDYTMARIIKGIPVFEEVKKQSKYPMEVIHNQPHSDMIAAFLRAKVYCQLSYTESFGMSLLEAMACGCVPVVADRGAMPDMVGNAGIIVPYGDVPATRHAIRVAMRMSGKKAKERAGDFSVEKRILHMHNVIDRVIRKNANTRSKMRESVFHRYVERRKRV